MSTLSASRTKPPNRGGPYPGTVAANVLGLWPVGVVQGHQRGAVGGFAGVRACGAVGVPQVVLSLPGGGLWGRLVHRDQRRDRTGSFGVDIPSGGLVETEIQCPHVIGVLGAQSRCRVVVQSGRQQRWIVTRLRCQMSPPSWVVTSPTINKAVLAWGEALLGADVGAGRFGGGVGNSLRISPTLTVHRSYLVWVAPCGVGITRSSTGIKHRSPTAPPQSTT